MKNYVVEYLGNTMYSFCFEIKATERDIVELLKSNKHIYVSLPGNGPRGTGKFLFVSGNKLVESPF